MTSRISNEAGLSAVLFTHSIQTAAAVEMKLQQIVALGGLHLALSLLVHELRLSFEPSDPRHRVHQAHARVNKQGANRAAIIPGGGWPCGRQSSQLTWRGCDSARREDIPHGMRDVACWSSNSREKSMYDRQLLRRNAGNVPPLSRLTLCALHKPPHALLTAVAL